MLYEPKGTKWKRMHAKLCSCLVHYAASHCQNEIRGFLAAHSSELTVRASKDQKPDGQGEL
jgi:hypothetical protein